MGEVALEIACDPRDMSEITALAVTFRQSRKDAEDLRVPLGAERGVERDELIARKMLAMRAPGGTVASEKLPFKRFRHVQPGILKQRHEVIGEGPFQRVLEVQNPNPLYAFPLGKPHQVGRMIVPEDPAQIGPFRLGETGAPQRGEFLGERWRSFFAVQRRPQPVDEQTCLGQHRLGVIGWQSVGGMAVDRQ